MSRVSKNLRSPRMSLRSRLTEEQFRSTDYRSLWTKRSNEEWIKHIERVRHMSDDPYPNPGDWIGQRVDEYWIDGMQVFCCTIMFTGPVSAEKTPSAPVLIQYTRNHRKQ